MIAIAIYLSQEQKLSKDGYFLGLNYLTFDPVTFYNEIEAAQFVQKTKAYRKKLEKKHGYCQFEFVKV